MRRLTLLLLAPCLLLATSLFAQTHPNLERGMNVGKAYQVGDVDSVSLFNGNLSIAIPLGQAYSAGGGLNYSFVLRYNSNVWDHNLETFTNDCTLPYSSITVTQSVPHELSSGLNGGLGWSLDFGTLLYSGSGQTLDRWTYVAPDGSTHPFYPTMHDGETERAGFRYTRDGSFMRLVASSYSPGSACPGGWLGATVELADGRRQSFSRTDTCNPFVLNADIDRFGNSLTFTLDTANDRWVLDDSQGRTHYIGLQWLDGYKYRVISYVDLATFGGGLTRYGFTYATRNIARSCKHYHDPAWDDCDPQLDPTVTVPLLLAVTQPDGSQWTMGSLTSPGYNLDTDAACLAGSIPRDRPGTLNHLKNPVGGTYDWTYATWRNPEGGASCYSVPAELDNVRDATGVYDRTLADPLTGSGGGVWRYRHDSWHLPSGEVDPSAQESWTTVTTPESDESKHYFRTQYCGGAAEGWDYGLPYTRGRYGTGAEPYVSAEHYDGSASTPSNLRRRSYLRYAKDALNSSWTPSWLQQSNRQVDFEKTVFADDASRYTTVNYSDYDGLGHFRVVTTGGDFGSGNTRQTTTAYNGTLSYPPATPPAEWWPYTSPWIINTYTSSKVAEGGSVAKREACFESSTGYILRTRGLRLVGSGADPAQSTTDVLSRRTHASGNTTREESFGGDEQTVGAGALCGLALPAPAYRVDHTYQYGSLKTSRYVDPAGTPLSFYLVDRDIDANTGLVATSRDTAGLATDLTYDAMGRLTWQKPRSSPVSGGSWVQHCYSTASPPSTPARIESSWWPNGNAPACGSTAPILQRAAVEVDGFGRTWREARRIFDGSWAQRLTAYNGLGWTTSISEWQPPNPPVVKKTEYLGFDPFGRPGTIRPADGPAHDTTLTYSGIRLTSRTVMIATEVGSETPSTTIEEIDRQGRLWKVTEPSGDSGANVTTTYSYDVGGRLKQASTSAGITQNRLFTYDGRGFLTSEQLPEVGLYGNGTVTYSKYDARGHARRIQDGEHDVAYTYDAAERLTQVAQAILKGVPGTPVLRAFTYATANGTGNWKNGKPESATSYNPDLTGASVVETYTWGGFGGRVSSRRTVVEGRTINQAFTWNDLGQLASVGYPDDTALGSSVEPSRTVTYGYTHGSLTGVDGYVPSVSYHANGMVNEVLHANGMKDVHTKDPDDIPRAARIDVQRVSDGVVYGGWGPCTYDGAGNVKTIGLDTYTYDLVSRVRTGTATAGAYRQCASYSAFGAVKGLGTGTTSCTASPIALDEATNRMASPVTYDAAGNMTGWGGYGYGWSRQNQMVLTTGPGINRRYAYTVDGERVLEQNFLNGTRTLWIRDLSGKVLREYGRTNTGAWSWSKDYVYRDGLLAATVTAAETRHEHLDYLGSVRGATDTQPLPGVFVGTIRDYYPFGLDSLAGTDPERMRFTGHQRDTQGTVSQTDDLDYMHARHYSPVVGRFLSVDPGRDNDPRAPQSWNLYAYARNNPIRYVDPDGRAAKIPESVTANYDRNFSFRASVYSTLLAAGPAGEGAALAADSVLKLALPSSNGEVIENFNTALMGMVAGVDLPTGEFSIIKWQGFPEGVPKPTGPFRILAGEEYQVARSTANNANRVLRSGDATLAGKQIHEIQPVKLNGSPTNVTNKVALPPQDHAKVTTWFNRFLRQMKEFLDGE